jgi:ABC-2 type transport system permease protein
VLPLTGGSPLGEGGVAATLVWFGVVVAYSLFWFLLATFVVAQGWTSATNAFALALAWLALVILTPSAISAGIEAAYPTPSRIGYIETLREESAVIRRDREQVAEEFFATHPGLRPAGEEQAKEANYYIRGVEIDRRLHDVEAQFDQQLRRQQDLGESLKFTSPAVLAHSAFLDLAGSGLVQQRRFLEQVAGYHEALKDYFLPKIIKGEYDFHGYREFPRFDYRRAEANDLDASLAALGALLAQGLPLGLLGFWRLRKYPVVSV